MRDRSSHRHYLHKLGLAPPLKNLMGQLYFTGMRHRRSVREAVKAP